MMCSPRPLLLLLLLLLLLPLLWLWLLLLLLLWCRLLSTLVSATLHGAFAATFLLLLAPSLALFFGPDA
jgi:ABC-type sulfate transport system permease component